MIFTISVLLAGLGYTVAKFLFNYNCIDICSEKEFYRCQNIISPVILEIAKKSVQKYADQIQENSIISIDGALDHRRHGSACIVTFIDIVTRKIIDFEIDFQDKQFVEGNTKECSCNLEKVCVERLVERWKSSQKVSFYTHDNDGVTRNIFEKSGWNVTEI